MSRRIERKLTAVTNRLALVVEQERIVEAELAYHSHLHDDAARDAEVTDNPIDREDARRTAADVRRFTRQLERLGTRKAALEAKRQRLVEALDG